MARPMILMEETLLKELYQKYTQGVPVLKLIRQHKLDNKITAPTLTKLLSYMDAMLKADHDIHLTIYHSLFPYWGKQINPQTIVYSNPYSVYYQGKMPLGEWKERETNNERTTFK